MRRLVGKVKSILSRHPVIRNVLVKTYRFFYCLLEETFNVICWCIGVFLPLVLLSYLFYLTFAGTFDKVSFRVSNFYRIELR